VAEREPLDEARLGQVSRRVAEVLFNVWPHLRSHASMERGAEADGLSLYVEAVSPTGDEERRLGVFFDEGGVPSVGFGPWHSHGDVLTESRDRSRQVSAVLDIVGAILRDEFVLISEVGGEYPGHTTVVDLRVPNALADELTNRYSSGVANVRSWSGARDHQASLDTVSVQ